MRYDARVWTMPSPTDLYGSNAVARALDLDRRSADRLIAAGLAGEQFRTERGIHVRPNPVNTLSQRPWVDQHPGALVIRLGAVQKAPDGDDRPYVGWHAELADSDWRMQLSAIDRWWGLREPRTNLTVVYTLSTFVVHVATLNCTDAGPGSLKMLRFNTHTPEAVQTAFSQKRVHTGRGGNTVWLRATQA